MPVFILKFLTLLKWKLFIYLTRQPNIPILKFCQMVHKLNFLGGIFMFWMLIFLAVFLSIRFHPLFWNFALQAYFEWEPFVFVFLSSVSSAFTPPGPVVLWLPSPSCSGLPAPNLVLQSFCPTVELRILWLASWLDGRLHFYLLFPSCTGNLLKIQPPGTVSYSF